MPGRAKDRGYHHGDLRSALIDAALEIVAERGVHGFTLAEATRRVGVAASAPYAHFPDRDALLAAVAVHGFQVFNAEFLPAAADVESPGRRLAMIAHAYVRFAGIHRPLFEVLHQAGLDKVRHPEIKAVERPLTEAFLDSVRALSAGAEAAELAAAVEATAHGHAMLLLDGDYGQGGEAIDRAAERAARATLALVAARQLLGVESRLVRRNTRRRAISADP